MLEYGAEIDPYEVPIEEAAKLIFGFLEGQGYKYEPLLANKPYKAFNGLEVVADFEIARYKFSFMSNRPS